jgi:hypothetical protein
MVLAYLSLSRAQKKTHPHNGGDGLLVFSLSYRSASRPLHVRLPEPIDDVLNMHAASISGDLIQVNGYG